MNLEIALMARFCDDYNNKDAFNLLTLIQKIEVFKYALQATDGRDLAKVVISYSLMTTNHFFLFLE
jgi:hypothetical protein